MGDLLFKCEQCGIPLVVDWAAAGMTLNCECCGKPTRVPHSGKASCRCNTPAVEANGKIVELHHRLKENESQRTEISGYINQLSIQLHRWQLRLQTLNDRNKELSDEIKALQAPPGP